MFMHRTMQTPLAPAMVPVQVWPAGTAADIGCESVSDEEMSMNPKKDLRNLGPWRQIESSGLERW